MTDDLEPRFDLAMMSIYHRARNEARYTATRFFQMLHEHRVIPDNIYMRSGIETGGNIIS